MSTITSLAPQTTPAAAVVEAASSFCFTCGFNFGRIVAGVDNSTAGILLVLLFFLILCSPCIVMSCCYICGRSKNKRYAKVVEDDDDEV